jgi:NAD-dependent DNA ligase
VTILGRTVEKASLGSEAKMRELGVTEGATVVVGLSNDVTPKIYRVVA